VTLESRIRRLEERVAPPEAAEEQHKAKMRALILELGFATEAEMARPFDFEAVCERFFPLLSARVAARPSFLLPRRASRWKCTRRLAFASKT
jgi:hypothetical protein